MYPTVECDSGRVVSPLTVCLDRFFQPYILYVHVHTNTHVHTQQMWVHIQYTHTYVCPFVKSTVVAMYVCTYVRTYVHNLT